jgi:hypothetical protein
VDDQAAGVAVIGYTSAVTKVYEEIVDFIARGSTPAEVATFEASPEVRARVRELIDLEKGGTIEAEQRAELDQFMQLEHVMRLAKAKARALVRP